MRRGDLVDDRFEVDDRVGAGGMGTVYRAVDRHTRAEVAIKLVEDEDLRSRFMREARVIASLGHPAIVRYVAHGALPSGALYLAMEWIEGEDLSRRLKRCEISPVEAVTILSRVAGGLAAAHAIGIVHRDIKPGNIFLAGGDATLAKIIDFGLARLAAATHTATQTGVILGTPGYMAPEQAKGLAVIDARADVFSLGCVIYRCLAGRPPFEGKDVLAVLAKLVLEEPPPISAINAKIPAALSDLVARMMAKDPADRPPNGAAVLEAIAAIDLSSMLAADAPRRRPSDTIAAVSETEGRPAPVNPTPYPRPPSQAGDVLTLNEQRIVSMVIAAADGDAEDRSAVAPEIERLGGRLNVLAGGSLIVTVRGPGTIADRAARAGRCALAIRSHFADLSVCVVTGRGVVLSQVVEGEAIDRGVRAVRQMSRGVIGIDRVTAGLLDAAFIIDAEADGFVLRGERHLRETAPLLLGKQGPCVGRGRELALLEGFFASAVSEPEATSVLMTGPAGCGKSRLRRELIEKLRRHNDAVEILTGRADSFGESAAFGPIADAIRETAGIWGAESIESRRQKLTQRVRRRLEGDKLARVTAFLGELCRAPFPEQHHKALRAARENAQLMGDGMRAAWEDWLTAECEAQPVVLILEDLHWADAATVQMIDATLRNLRDLPLLVLALARPEVHARFPALWAERSTQIMKLSPLSRKASEQLVRSALGGGATAEVIASIVERADGNPFYLEELIRAVVAGRGDAFPDSVLATIEARLDAEGPEAKRALRAASVFGARFTARGVAALLGGADPCEASSQILSRLAAREIIVTVEAPEGADDIAYAFRHTLVREAAYAMLTETDRALGHWLAGEWLEQTGHTDAEAMAEHFHRGGDLARAARHYLSAAEEALEATDLTAAIERAERGVACGAAGEERGRLRLIEAEARLWRGELGLAEASGIDAVEAFAVGSAGWFRAAGQVIIAAGKLGAFDRVERWVDPIRAASPASGAEGARIITLSWCVTYLTFGARFADADAILAELSSMEAPDPQSVAMIWEARAIRALAGSDLGGCLESLNAALSAFEQAGDLRNVCVTSNNLGFIYAELGDFEGAEAVLRAAMSTADRMGLLEPSMQARHNLGYALAHRGKPEEARFLQQQAIDASHRHGQVRAEGTARVYLARIHGMTGDLAAAEEEARAAVEVLAAVPSLRAGALAVLGRTLLATGRAEEALLAASEAFSLLLELGSMEEGEAMLHLAYAEALDANGRSLEFVEAIGTACARLLERADKIRDPMWRERFLTEVPDNVATLELASRAATGETRSRQAG